MTKEEAKEWLDTLHYDYNTCEETQDIAEAIRMAIQALEKEPCPYWDYGSNTCRHANIGALAAKPYGDAISREEVLDILKAEWVLDKPIEEWSVYRDVVDLTSVQPKSPWIRIEFKGDALNCPLPDDGERVFLRFKNGYVTADTCQITIDEEDNTCYVFEDNPDFEDIDAWMRIPE